MVDRVGMDGMMSAMMGGWSLIGLLAVVALVLAVAALLKYLGAGRR